MSSGNKAVAIIFLVIFLILLVLVIVDVSQRIKKDKEKATTTNKFIEDCGEGFFRNQQNICEKIPVKERVVERIVYVPINNNSINPLGVSLIIAITIIALAVIFRTNLFKMKKKNSRKIKMHK